MVFTIVTVIFLPMSFIAAVFAIPLTNFDNGQGAPTVKFSYVAKFIFGVGLAISIPLIAVAFAVDSISTTLTGFRRKLFRGNLRTVQEKTLQRPSSDDSIDSPLPEKTLRDRGSSGTESGSAASHLDEDHVRHRTMGGWRESRNGRSRIGRDLEKGS